MATAASAGIGVNAWRRCARRSDIRSRRTPRPRILRLLDRLELVCAQIVELERERDAVLDEKAPDKAGGNGSTTRRAAGHRCAKYHRSGRGGVVREFANGKALGSYAGLTATPFSSEDCSSASKGSTRPATGVCEAMWSSWPGSGSATGFGSAQVIWFRDRVGGTGKRIAQGHGGGDGAAASDRFVAVATQGVVPEGAVQKPAL